VIEFPKALELKELIIIYPTNDDFEESMDLSVTLLKKGTPVQAVDIMIAAMCIRRNLTLSTNDSDFTNIKRVRNSFRFEMPKALK
jgi:tRNA(fMet)-specific endonuclease VapC